MADPDRKTWRDEPFRAVLAFVAVTLLSLFVIVAIWVGNADVDPRVALVRSLVPALLIGALGACWGPTRRIFSRSWVGGG